MDRSLDSYANNRSHSLSDSEYDQRVSRRFIKSEYRAVLREVSSLPRVSKCGHTIRRSSGVGLVADMNLPAKTRSAGLRGLYSCGSVWACPRCSEIIHRKRAEEVRTVLKGHAAKGGQANLLTLTFGHNSSHSLDDLWDILSNGWKNFTNNRTWKSLNGRNGYIRGTEITFSGEHGWHVHLHVLILFDSVNSALNGLVASKRIFQAWRSAIGNLDGPFYSVDDALDIRPADMDPFLVDSEDSTVSDYLFKSSEIWSVADEATRWSAKKGRGSSRTPFQILAGVADPDNWNEDGNGESDLDLWHEWENASQSRRQLVWSRGLKKQHGLVADPSDEELVQDSDHGDEDQEDLDLDRGTDEVAGVTAEEWNRNDLGAAYELLEAMKGIAETSTSRRELHRSLSELGDLYGVEILRGRKWRKYLKGVEDSRRPLPPYRSRRLRRTSRFTDEFKRGFSEKKKAQRAKTESRWFPAKVAF